MKKLHLIFTVVLIMFSWPSSAQNHPLIATEKPVVALLGIFHFAGTNDLISIKADDLASPQRQSEIKDVVKMLRAYQPTKIIVEYPFMSTGIDSLYQQYLIGKHDLSIHESQQIGFRLASQLGHGHIYPADHKLPLPFPELASYMDKSNQMEQLNAMVEDMKRDILAVSQKAYNEQNLSDYFVFMNSHESDVLNKKMYLQYTNKMGDKTNPVGTKLVSKWWERNFNIMHNIDQITEPGDRLLIIFGQGHTAVLKDFYKSRTDIVYEDVVRYLRP